MRCRKDARAAAEIARKLGDPAVLLDCLIALLEVDGSDAVLGEARQTAHRILRMLSQESLRSAFVASLAERQPRVLDK